MYLLLMFIMNGYNSGIVINNILYYMCMYMLNSKVTFIDPNWILDVLSVGNVQIHDDTNRYVHVQHVILV